MKQLQDIPWKVRQETDKEVRESPFEDDSDPIDDKQRNWLVETASGLFVADCGCLKGAEEIARLIAGRVPFSGSLKFLAMHDCSCATLLAQGDEGTCVPCAARRLLQKEGARCPSN